MIVIENRVELLLVVPGRARSFRSPVAADYVRHIQSIGRGCLGALLEEGDIEVRLDYFHRGHRRVDMDNVSKLVLDALNGIAYRDDRQVRTQSSRSHCVDEVVSIHRDVFDLVKPLAEMDEYLVVRVSSAEATRRLRNEVTS